MNVNVQKTIVCFMLTVFCLALDNDDMKCIVSDYWSLPANKSSAFIIIVCVLQAQAIKYIYWNRL